MTSERSGKRLSAVEGTETPSSDIRRLRQPMPPLALNRLMQRVARSIHRKMDEADVLECYFDAFEQLASDRIWALRVIEGKRIRLLRSSRPLPEKSRDRVRISELALLQAGLDGPFDGSFADIEVTPQYECEIGRSGFDVPLFDGAHLIGVLSCESEDDAPAIPELPILAAPLGSLLASARRHREGRAFLEHLAAIVMTAKLPIVFFDERGNIELASAVFANLVGRHDLLGVSFLDLIDPTQRDDVARACVKYERVDCDLATDPPVRMSFEMMPLAHPSIRASGTIAFGRDLREVQALQRQIVHSEKLATLGQLAAGVAHELNNPLTSITVYSQHLRERADDIALTEADVERMNRIIDAAERIRTFSQNLTSYARPAGGGPPKALSIPRLVEEALGFCEHVVRDANAEVRLALPLSLPEIRGVRSSLHQVFVNLITNACHAMPAEGELRISARPDQGQLCVCVEDNGAGIALEDHARVFEPFYTTKTEGQGTGLGLSIVRSIVEQQGGSITLESGPDEGARFLVRLPLAPEDS